MTVNVNEKFKKINNTEKKVLIEMLANPGKTYSRRNRKNFWNQPREIN